MFSSDKEAGLRASASVADPKRVDYQVARLEFRLCFFFLIFSNESQVKSLRLTSTCGNCGEKQQPACKFLPFIARQGRFFPAEVGAIRTRLALLMVYGL